MSVMYTPTAAVRATAQEFDDSDAPAASAINPLGEAAFDTATWLVANRGNGGLRLQAVDVISLSGGTLGSSNHATFDGTGDVTISAATLVCAQHDAVEVSINALVNCSGADDHCEFRLAYQPGGSGTIYAIANVKASYELLTNHAIAMHLTGWIPDWPSATSVTVLLQMCTPLTAGGTANVFAPIGGVVKQWRVIA